MNEKERDRIASNRMIERECKSEKLSEAVSERATDLQRERKREKKAVKLDGRFKARETRKGGARRRK